MQQQEDNPQPQPRKTSSRGERSEFDDHEHDFCLAGGRCKECGLTKSQLEPPATDDKLCQRCQMSPCQCGTIRDPAPLGEQWTSLKVWELLDEGGGDMVAETINAALAAEQNRTKLAIDECNGVIKELAAEREQVTEWKRAHKAVSDLADGAIQRRIKAEQQLLQAQAAIAEHNNGREGIYPTCRITVDLSALDKHDAEVRKPMVDALEKAAETFADLERAMKLFGKFGCMSACQIAGSYCRDALAKVKEQP